MNQTGDGRYLFCVIIQFTHIHNTDLIRELAKFWDTHNLTYFENQLEDVTYPVFENKRVVQITFKPAEVEAVKEVASLRVID